MRKNILRNTLRIFALSVMLVAGIAANAVTPEEMERARAVAATVYLRYTNDKSDYLDNFKPQTMSEVRNKVSRHDEDVKNLEKFMSVPVSKDFASWGKDELVAYWGGRFFENSGLSEKASKVRNNKITARLRTMEVTPPAAEPAPAPDTAQQSQQTPYNGYQDADMSTVQQPAPDSVTDSAATATEDQKVIVNKKSDNSMALILLLIVLIIIAICLVAFALKTMRKNKKAGNNADDNNVRFEPQTSMVIEDRPAKRVQNTGSEEYMPRPAEPEGSAELKYARIIQQKNEMIESLRSSLDESRRHADNQTAVISRLQADVQRLNEEVERLRNTPRSVSPLPAPGRPVSEAPRPRRYETPQPRPAAPTRSDSEMVIYLGRANHEKVFVRADKQLTQGKSIYRMITSNGLTGSFYVDTDPAVAALVSLDPQAALSGACEVPTFANADNFTRIVTDTAGTAIFEDGCWKVLRPAAVHLE